MAQKPRNETNLMDALTEIKTMVDRIVSDVLETKLSDIRAEVVQRVEGELQPLLVQREGATALLNVSVNAIQGSLTQADILNSVLDGATNFAGRAILFVVRGDEAVAWNSRGFHGDVVNDLKLAISSGPVAEVMQGSKMQGVSAVEFLPEVMGREGEPMHADALLFALAVRDKVPAMLYADSGTSRPARLDANALQLLLRSAALWLEVVASRRGAQPGSGAPNAKAATTEIEWNRASETGVTPERISTAPLAEAPRPEPPVVPAERVSESAADLTGVAEEVRAPAPDAELSNRARRFARLLVDEIILYNQQKVEDGRAKHDLYERLRDDIEKSRAAYQKRYGALAEAGTPDYFREEIVAKLANNDRELLGSGWRE